MGIFKMPGLSEASSDTLLDVGSKTVTMAKLGMLTLPLTLLILIFDVLAHVWIHPAYSFVPDRDYYLLDDILHCFLLIMMTMGLLSVVLYFLGRILQKWGMKAQSRPSKSKNQSSRG